MATLKELNLRLASLTSTRKITQAMKLIATTKLNKFQGKIKHSFNYYHTLCETFTKVGRYLRAYPELLGDNPLWKNAKGSSKTVKLLLFTSDRGLCGSFNANIIKKAFELAEQLSNAGNKVVIDFYGKQGFDFFKKRKFSVGIKYESVFSDVYQDVIAYDFAKNYIDGYLNDEFQELYIVYNSYVSAISQKPVVKKALPFDFSGALVNSEKSSTVSPDGSDEENYRGLFEPNLELFVEYLIKQFVSFEFYFAFLNSTAGEHAARMTSMDSATKNSTDMIDRITLERNRVRQAAITKELIEIISGAESV